jgi:aminoglycoside phosphotransferase (APT) family kinase protein
VPPLINGIVQKLDQHLLMVAHEADCTLIRLGAQQPQDTSAFLTAIHRIPKRNQPTFGKMSASKRQKLLEQVSAAVQIAEQTDGLLGGRKQSWSLGHGPRG